MMMMKVICLFMVIEQLIGSKDIIYLFCFFILFSGPFKRNNEFNGESDKVFDESLRNRNPEWGYRNIEDLDKLALENNLTPVSVIDMPSNNFVLIYKQKKK